jgi:hypothetical protein
LNSIVREWVYQLPYCFPFNLLSSTVRSISIETSHWVNFVWL